MADVDAVDAVTSTLSYDAWADQHVVTVPAARLDKHDRMAGDPFAFLRGTYYLWVQRVAEVEPASVRKKMKDKAFARAVSREMMLAGAEDLGVPFDELAAEVVTALSGVADRLGLAGPTA